MCYVPGQASLRFGGRPDSHGHSWDRGQAKLWPVPEAGVGLAGVGGVEDQLGVVAASCLRRGELSQAGLGSCQPIIAG
jgi:hypothetical protein